jgi:hypothetical protein
MSVSVFKASEIGDDGCQSAILTQIDNVEEGFEDA